MTRTDEMVAWLRAQLGEDEDLAKDAVNYTTGRWELIVTTAGRSKVVDSFGYSVSETDDESSAPWFTHPHIARWDPARALAEVDAKRKILEIHYRIECQHDRNFSTGGDCAECGGEYPCETVRLLALPYADRPGFPDEWKP